MTFRFQNNEYFNKLSISKLVSDIIFYGNNELAAIYVAILLDIRFPFQVFRSFLDKILKFSTIS